MSSLRAGLTAAVAATVFLSACGNSSHEKAAPATHPDEPVVTGEPAGSNAADVTFADALIAEDQQGIDTAKLVPSRSANAKVVAFATTSTTARQSETSVLKVLEVQWNSNQENPNGQRNPAPATGLIEQATLAKLQSLRDVPFETLWLRSMIALDAASIEAANAEVANGKNVDAVDMARQIAAARPGEIDQMKKMLGT